MRCTCVSTTTPDAMPNAVPSTTLAVLRAAPGTVKSAELEREHGKLICSFDIDTKNGVTEVNVDAITGAVVGTQHESAAKEAAEKKQEAKEKKH